MAKEIERKFLIKRERLALPDNGKRLVQGYIPTATNTAVRIRIKGQEAFLTIKGENCGAVRSEFEYPIPLADAEAMLAELCGDALIEKVRYCIPVAGHIWEVDVFEGANAGLIVAEIELQAEDERFEKPEWVGDEVTGDARYFNSNLIARPFSHWPIAE